MSRTNSVHKFRRGYTVFLIVLAGIFLVTLAALWIFLARFQAKTDQEQTEKAEAAAVVQAEKDQAEAERRAPQLAFESWLAQATPDTWTELWYAKQPDSIDLKDSVRASMETIFSSDSITAWKSADYTDAAPVYVLKNGDETLARIALSGGGTSWSVSNVELLVTGNKSASVKAAVGSKVYCNGVELSDEYAGEPSTNFDYEPLTGTVVNPTAWVVYTVNGLFTDPVLTAEPPAGYQITETAEGDFLLCLGDEAGKSYRDTAVKFVRSYLYYYMSGYNGTQTNLWSAMAYLTPNTQAYADLRDTYDGVVWNTAYSNIDTSNTTAGGVVVWGDNCYSVDVTYDAKCTLNGEAVDYASATMRIYYVNYGDGFVISNFETL